MATLWNPQPVPTLTRAGEFAAFAQACFFDGATTRPILGYADEGLTTPHDWPVIANAVGMFPPVFVPYGRYRVRVATQYGVLLYDAGDIDAVLPSTAPTFTPTVDEVLRTGQIGFAFTDGVIIGFVRMAGGTIGDATSGATEYAAPDARPLFEYLWNNCDDADAPVSGGRGATAAADWAAAKTIGVPTMHGVTPVGRTPPDAASGTQVVTVASATNGLNTITVASATNIVRGMSVTVDGLSMGVVTTVSGLTITCGDVFTGGTASGLTARFSPLADAQQPGSFGGGQSFTMTALEMPSHSHAVTDPGHVHVYDYFALVGHGAGAFSTASPTGLVTGASPTGVTAADAGDGRPIPLIQPSRLFNFYMKL